MQPVACQTADPGVMTLNPSLAIYFFVENEHQIIFNVILIYTVHAPKRMRGYIVFALLIPLLKSGSIVQPIACQTAEAGGRS